MINLYLDLCADVEAQPMRQKGDVSNLMHHLEEFRQFRHGFMDFATRLGHKHHKDYNLTDADKIVRLLAINPVGLTLRQSLLIAAYAQPAMGLQSVIGELTGWTEWTDNYLPKFLAAVLPPAQAALTASVLYGNHHAMIAADGQIQTFSYNMYAAQFPEVWDYPETPWRPGFRKYKLFEIIDGWFLRHYGVLKLDMSPMIRVGALLPMSFGEGDKFRGSFPAIAQDYMRALLTGACLPYSSTHWRHDEHGNDTTKLSYTAIATV